MERASVRTASPIFHLSLAFRVTHSCHVTAGEILGEQPIVLQIRKRRPRQPQLELYDGMRGWFPKSQAGGLPVAFSVACHAAPTEMALEKEGLCVRFRLYWDSY